MKLEWEQVKPVVLLIAVVVSGIVSALGGIHQERGRGKKALEVQAVQMEQHCDSLMNAKLVELSVERRAMQASIDSLVRLNERRDAIEIMRRSMRSRSSSSSSSAVSSRHDCGCGITHRAPAEKQPSFLSRWAPPLLGLAAGIAIGHAWAPEAAATIVNVVGSNPPPRDGHYHGKRWERGKSCGDRKWHRRGGHRGRDKD